MVIREQSTPAQALDAIRTFYEMEQCLVALDETTLNHLPVWFLKRIAPRSIHFVFHLFKPEYQRQLIGYTTCYEHPWFDEQVDGGDEPDCPRPLRIDCHRCRVARSPL